MVGQRGVQRDKVGARQQCIKVDLFDAHLDRALRRQKRIERDHLHPQTERPAGDNRADITRPDQTQRLTGNFDTHEPVLGPHSGLRLGIGFGQLPREREHQRNRVLGCRNRIAERGVHHHHALRRGGGNIDVVDPDSGAADNFEVGGGSKDRLSDFGRAANREPIIVADPCDQLFGGFAGDFINIAAAFTKDRSGIGVHLVGNEYAGLGHFGDPSSSRA